MSLGRALRYEYESYLKAKRDLRAMREYDREEGLAEGRAEGRAKGRAEGIAEGRAEGIALTKEVLRLSAQGMTASKIAKQLELSTDQVLDILSVLKE